MKYKELIKELLAVTQIEQRRAEYATVNNKNTEPIGALLGFINTEAEVRDLLQKIKKGEVWICPF